MPEIFKNPKYRGKHVVLIAGKIYTAKTSAEVTSILKKTEKQYPNDTPEYAYLPKARSLEMDFTVKSIDRSPK